MTTSCGTSGRTVEPNYRSDLSSLVALAKGAAKEGGPRGPIGLVAPESVRDAIRRIGAPLVPPAGVARQSPRRTAALPVPVAPSPAPHRSLRLAALPMVAIVLAGAVFASMRGAERAEPLPVSPPTSRAIESPWMLEGSTTQVVSTSAGIRDAPPGAPLQSRGTPR